jgi:3-oxoacyl-[acyl-carrier protein] reductase
MSLEGASVLVTGGTRGIGRAIALRLVADGASRAVLGYMRNDTAAEEAAALVQEAGGEAVLVRGNVADAAVVDELAAGGPYRRRPQRRHRRDPSALRDRGQRTGTGRWPRTRARSPSRATVPAMEEGGSILAISSLGSAARAPELRPRRDVEGGAPSRSSATSPSTSRRAIRVNCVSAGVVDTGR